MLSAAPLVFVFVWSSILEVEGYLSLRWKDDPAYFLCFMCYLRSRRYAVYALFWNASGFYNHWGWSWFLIMDVGFWAWAVFGFPLKCEGLSMKPFWWLFPCFSRFVPVPFVPWDKVDLARSCVPFSVVFFFANAPHWTPTPWFRAMLNNA